MVKCGGHGVQRGCAESAATGRCVWMRCECCELPSVFRFDCFVRRRKGAGGNVIAGKCDVFTGEARAHPIGARVCACTCVRVTALFL